MGKVTKILLLILLLGAAVRTPGMTWGYLNYDGFQPDESQHFSISRNFINTFDSEYIDSNLVTEQFNGGGLGVQAAVLGYFPLIFLDLSPDFLYAFNRIVSFIYGIGV